jgi:hypothetical protein
MFYVFQNYARVLAFLLRVQPFSFIMRRFFDPSNVNVGVSGTCTTFYDFTPPNDPIQLLGIQCGGERRWEP